MSFEYSGLTLTAGEKREGGKNTALIASNKGKQADALGGFFLKGTIAVKVKNLSSFSSLIASPYLRQSSLKWMFRWFGLKGFGLVRVHCTIAMPCNSHGRDPQSHRLVPRCRRHQMARWGEGHRQYGVLHGAIQNEPLNKGHIGTGHFVLSSSQQLENVLYIILSLHESLTIKKLK